MGRCKRKVITCRVGPNALAMVLRFPVGALCCWLARQVSPDRHHPGYPNHGGVWHPAVPSCANSPLSRLGGHMNECDLPLQKLRVEKKMPGFGTVLMQKLV
ncbi:hypothetical protein SAY86_001188 [Trapa natans]|uniref:Uncharacterized protein n=1 Tax=Trapa natans TaxID=22666 RepID=A0AAN7RHD1_TRANT|nr:hypothetical protein SAY86_001188 [Trapa natans]